MPSEGPRTPDRDFSGIGGPAPDELELRAQQRRAQRRPPDKRSPARRPGAIGPRRIMFVGLALLAVALISALFQPFAGAGGERVVVQIPKSAGAGEIGTILADRGVVESAKIFEVRATLAGKRGDLKPGNYQMRIASPYGTVIDRLVEGPPTKVINIVVPEGLDRRRAAPIVSDAGITGNYMAASSNTSLIPARRYGAAKAQSLEGFLFPATYELRPSATAAQFVRKQVEGFELNLSQVNMSAAREKNLTVYDVVTIASMIEGEASLEKERPLVAAVVYNRLKQGIPLGIDATTRFETNNYTEPLTKSTLQADTPFNTRINTGLPPGPIGNPGLASLKAAARPAKVDYLYYVAKPGACGEHSFSTSAAEFDRDVAAYEAAREAAGGKDPQKCP